MLKKINFSSINNSNLINDYISGNNQVFNFFTHKDIESSLKQRQKFNVNRLALKKALLNYHKNFKVSPNCIKNINKLDNNNCVFITTGQQAGFMGGPLYTLYKIITCIKLSKQIEDKYKIPVIPLFWLASEDHDFDEINRATRVDYTGILKTTTFKWNGIGRPISDLEISQNIKDSFEEFTKAHHNFKHYKEALKYFSIPQSKSYCHWSNQIWLNLFSECGLVVIEPNIINKISSNFFNDVIKKTSAISQALHKRSDDLELHNYPVAFNPNQAGRLFTFDKHGMRIRLKNNTAKQYSTDAALRPILLDNIAPTIAHVLGPGELTYHAMLQPLYKLLKTPQPYLQLRESFSILNNAQLILLKSLNVTPEHIIINRYKYNDIFNACLNNDDIDKYQQLLDIYQSLKSTLNSFKDTKSLQNPIKKTKDSIYQNIQMFYKRLNNVRLNQNNICPQEILNCVISLWPNAPQERVLSPFSLIAQHSTYLIKYLLELPLPTTANHQIISLNNER